ncbi:MAG: LD-carboxypeptidase [Lachnospiraceae bacterium]|nr:LD-carboxypeptidase [Lachnospiraceae bacterium]
MKYPDYLKKKETIGFVAPSFGCATEPYHTAFLNAQKKFQLLGYQLDLGPNCYESRGIGISNTPEACGRELTESYVSDKNQAIISCGGGELMCEILDYVDFEKIKAAEPKWYMGYSDNTNFTFLLTTLCDVASIYGPCAGTFGMEPWHPSVQDAFDLMTGEKHSVSGYDGWEKESLKDAEHPLVPYNITEQRVLKVYDPQSGAIVESGQADVDISGRLVGGCLDCLDMLVGTKFDKVPEFNERYKEEGIIWFLEACDLNVMSIRRALWQLEHSGWFRYVKGFLIGRPLCFGQEIMGLDHYSAVLGVLEKYKVPVILDADVGHYAPMMPLVCGSYARIQVRGNEIRIEMK